MTGYKWCARWVKENKAIKTRKTRIDLLVCVNLRPQSALPSVRDQWRWTKSAANLLNGRCLVKNWCPTDRGLNRFHSTPLPYDHGSKLHDRDQGPIQQIAQMRCTETNSCYRKLTMNACLLLLAFKRQLWQLKTWSNDPDNAQLHVIKRLTTNVPRTRLNTSLIQYPVSQNNAKSHRNITQNSTPTKLLHNPIRNLKRANQPTDHHTHTNIQWSFDVCSELFVHLTRRIIWAREILKTQLSYKRKSALIRACVFACVLCIVRRVFVFLQDVFLQTYYPIPELGYRYTSVIIFSNSAWIYEKERSGRFIYTIFQLFNSCLFLIYLWSADHSQIT